MRRYAFEQQRLHCFDPAIGMEPLPHDAAVEHVVHGHEAHSLVMSHVCVNDHSLATLPFLLPRVVQRLVEPHASIHTGLPRRLRF